MSKLIKFKAWLTLDEAANYLSIIFAEKISTSDIFRLALDGHLKFSVNFVNGAYARKGNRLLYKDAEKVEVPSLDGNSNVLIVCGLKFSNQETGIVEEVVQFDEKVIRIFGIWDLTMIGGERLDLEHEFQMLTNGPSIDLINLDGCYIEDYSNGTIYELQESFEDNQFSAGSLAQLEDIKSKIAINNIPKGKAELLIKKHELDRKEFLKKARKNSDTSNFYPIGKLPDDSVLVVRTRSISEFIDTVNNDKKAEKPLNVRTENNYLRLIFTLANNIEGFNSTKPYEAAKLIIDETGIENISQQTIADYISKAHALDSKEKG